MVSSTSMMLMTTSNSTSVKPSRNPNRLEVLFIRNSQFRTFCRENHNHPAARLLQEAKLCLSVYQTEWRLAASSETDSRCPRVTSLPAGAPLIMRVIGRDGDLIHKTRSQSLDSSPRCLVVRIAGNDNGFVHRTDKWGKSAAGLKRITVTSMALINFEPDVSSTDPNMFCIADSKVDVANINAADSHDPEMIKRNEAF